MTADKCPHGDKDWRCPTCCLAELRRNHPRLVAAVRNRDQGGPGGGKAVFGSRVPINDGALALLQDIAAAGGLDSIEGALNTLRDPARLAAVKTNLRKWRSRCSLVLKDSTAPYPLLWPDWVPARDAKGQPVLEPDGEPKMVLKDKPVACPVVSDEGDCAGDLMVHRDDDDDSPNLGKPSAIVCRRDDDHAWTLANRGWLRLGVLLGGTVTGSPE